MKEQVKTLAYPPLEQDYATTEQGYDRLLQRFLGWAQQEEQVRGAALIGSRARADRPADVWSDMDLLVMGTEPMGLAQNTGWLPSIGTVWLSHSETTPDGRGAERRVLFAGGLDVDFAFFSVQMAQALLGNPSDGAWEVFGRGARVVLDKDGLLKQLLGVVPPLNPPEKPSQAAFLNVVNNFWYHTLWTAKHLRRGELWWAKMGCDGRLKELLLVMLEWHAQATQTRDTWMRGRFLEQWADPRAVRALPGVFAHYDQTDLWRGLFSTMDLFEWLAQETAQCLGYSYPAEGIQSTKALVASLAPIGSGAITGGRPS